VLLDQRLAGVGSALRSERSFFGVESANFASVSSGRRHAQLLIARGERKFSLSLWENEVEMAGGRTPELSDIAAAIKLALEHEERKFSDLVREIPFLGLKPFALSYERGTYIEDKWRALLASPIKRSGDDLFHWDELADLIKRAAARPELRRLLPYTSLNRFAVTDRSRPPDNSIPVIWPLGNERFALTPYFGGPSLAEGNASMVLDALIAHLPEIDRQDPHDRPEGTSGA
jgi:hypothetical protein